MRLLQHKCPTLRGDKEDNERRQTITCQNFNPNTGYLFHLMYTYITQGRPNRGLLRLTPRAQAIIRQGIRVYGTPLLQPTQITARTAQGNPVYIYHPTAIARLPIPSDTDIIYFTYASGTQQRTPTVGRASMRITPRPDGLQVEHHTRATILGAPSHGKLRTLADAVTATPPPTSIPPSTSTSPSSSQTYPSTGCLSPASPHKRWGCGWPSEACTPRAPCTSSNRSPTATHTAINARTRMQNTRTPATPQGSYTCG